MLILSRKEGERIWIGDDIVITVVDLRSQYGRRVRIGITAPEGVGIWREEIRDARDRGDLDRPPKKGPGP